MKKQLCENSYFGERVFEIQVIRNLAHGLVLKVFNLWPYFLLLKRFLNLLLLILI